MKENHQGFVLACLLLLLLICGADGKNSKVEELTPGDFKSKVLDSDATWAVEFYAPWCGHCKALAPEWEKFASAVSPSIRVGAVDADKYKDLAGQNGVTGFPTIKIFGSDKRKPETYQGQRTAAAIAQHCLQHLANQVQGALGMSSSSSSSSSSPGSGSKGGSGKSQVVHLTAADFDTKVLGGGEEWLVAFIAPWCGHCKKLHPEWEDAAKQMAGDYKMGMVDATVESSLAQKYGVNGYPTIKHFKADKSGKITPSDYQGGREASDFVNFASTRLEATGGGAPPPEITKQEVFDGQCNAERGGLCIVAFLPHILDDQSAGRNARLAQIMEARKKLGRTFKFMWVVGGENDELESRMGLGFGYPAMVAMSPAKKRYAVMKGAFTASNIVDFANGILRGKESTAEIKPWPLKWRKVPAWDGKDAAPIEEEDAE